MSYTDRMTPKLRAVTRLFTALVLLALSANIAWGQPEPPRQACNVLQAQWASAWPNSSRSRTLDENRSYSSGYRVGSPIDIDGGEPSSWHNLSFKLVNQPSPASFYLNKVSGQIQTYSERFDHEQRSSYPLSVEAWLQGGPKHRKNPSSAQRYCNERFTQGCGDCRLQTITVNVSISDEPERPPRPRAPRVTGVHGSLIASWGLVAITPKIISHDVQYRVGALGPFFNGPQGVIGTSATIENLDAHFNFEVRIRATNSLGASPWSSTTPARTTPPLPLPPPPEPEPEPPAPDPDPEPPPPPSPPPSPGRPPSPPSRPPSPIPPPITVPDAPTNLLADAGDKAVELAWDAPHDNGGAAIRRYEYRINGRNPWTSSGSTSTTHTLTGLVNGTEYVFEVRAVNQAGRSRASNRVKATPFAPSVLSFAHFANGIWITDLVFVNVSPHRTTQPAIYFYDQRGLLIAPESVVDVTVDMEVMENGALTVRTEIEPLGELTISTHGRGELVTGSVKVVSRRPIGGMLRFNHPDSGVAVMGASSPVGDVLFPVRRREGGITTGVALHNLESSPALVRCDLMREGVLLDAASIPLEANGQTSWLIDQAFPAADTSDFAGSVRCDAVGQGMFAVVALEMDPGNRIFTILPVAPIPEMSN